MRDAECPSRLSAHGKPNISPVWQRGFVVTFLVMGALSGLAYTERFPYWFDHIPQLDKALHFTGYGALAFFLDGALRRRMLRLGSVRVPMAAVLLLVPAAIEEYLQRYFEHRSSSIVDFGADVAGVVVFIWLSRRFDSATRSDGDAPD